MAEDKKHRTIKEVIEKHFHSLSKKQQKVASFVLNYPTFVGTHAASVVGRKAGTSETTVIRFCYAIGLTGYAELQKEMTLFVFDQSAASTLGNYFPSKEDLLQDQQFIEKVMSKDLSKIDRIIKQIDRELFNTVTKDLHHAKDVYIIGAGASKFATDWLHFTMGILRPNVAMIQTEAPDLIRTLQKMDDQSIVIVISLHRYMKEPVQLAQFLHQQGIHVVAITDSPLAPIHQYCRQALVLEQTEKSTIDLMPALISFLNSIVAGMITVNPSYYNEQRVNYDDFTNSFIAERWS